MISMKKQSNREWRQTMATNNAGCIFKVASQARGDACISIQMLHNLKRTLNVPFAL